MKKRISALLLALAMLSTNAYAELLAEMVDIGDISSQASRNVKVVKYINDVETVIYTGPLSGYDNGAWADVDFEDIPMMVLFDWESENDTVYITPVGEETDNVVIREENDIANNVSTLQTFTNGGIKCEVSLMYDDEYSENVMIKSKQLKVPMKITNTSNTDRNVICCIGEYDASGNLISTVASESIEVNSGETISAIAAKRFKSNADFAKVFIWDSEDIKPITNAIVLNETSIDYYPDNYADAQAIDVGHYVNGSIDSVNDIDYIKFTPIENGEYYFNCISCVNVSMTLLNYVQSTIKSNETSFSYSLIGGQEYYIKTSSNAVGKYLLSIQKDASTEAKSFDIYKFDEDMNIYKKSILEICDDLYYDDLELSKQMYSEYENILKEDTKLHELPDFLAVHPKELSNFDELVNQYYSTKYEEFVLLKQKYIDIIDEYDKNLNGYDEISTYSETIEENPIIGKYISRSVQGDGEENIENVPSLLSAATPTLSVVNTTSTTLTYNVTFPVSGKWGNTIYLYDFNTDNGLTAWTNVYGTDEYRKNGQYTISGLQPGGIYILFMGWSTDGAWFGGENSINRFVQLPVNTTENLVLYNGSRVSARLEAEDKALASNSDFNTWLARMDKTYSAYKELTGYTPYNSKKIEMKSTRENLNDYFNIEDGYNYWTVIFGYYNHTNVFKHSKAFYQGHMRRLSQGDWGDTPMHELSHVFDNDKWVFDAETLSQFKLYYAMAELDAKIYRPDRFDNNSNGWYTGENYYTLLKSDRYLDSYDDTFGSGKYGSEGLAVILIDIQREIGWEPFKKTFRYFSGLNWSQLPDSNGETLKLFLTKLKDYSGYDVLSLINSRDTGIIESEFLIDLEYVTPVYPTITGGSGGSSSEITVERGGYTTHQFTPAESGNYFIYTSPYGGSGVSNDTYLEVYTNPSLSGTPIASNDDYDGGRFSKVSVAMTEGTTYYIKVRHYNNGQLHAELNITKNIPVQSLTLDGYEDIITASGEFSVFSFTPETDGTYVFDVSNYAGGTTEYNTYIKLYSNESMTKLIGNDYKKIMVNLKAGRTYYMHFSGFLMKYARGRVCVHDGQRLEFTKQSGGSYIYVNNPETLTDADILQAETFTHTKNTLIYRQKNILGNNTIYVTHSGRDCDNAPTSSFYYDIDFENPTSQSVSINISGLNYLVTKEYTALVNLYRNRLNESGAVDITVEIPANSHKLLFKDILGQKLNIPINPPDDRYFLFGIFADFRVLNNKSITVNTLAAYEENYLDLLTYDENIYTNVNTIVSGAPVICYRGISQHNENEVYRKMKGTDRDSLPEVKATLNYVIDDTTPSQRLSVNIADEFYDKGIANPKNTWVTACNPLNDLDWGIYTAAPSNLHGFEYEDTYNGENGKWVFDFLHYNPKFTEYSGYTTFSDKESGELNYTINDTLIDHVKTQASIYRPDNAPRSLPLGMSYIMWQDTTMMQGAWGVTYTYDININNIGNQTRNFRYGLEMANFVGAKVVVRNNTTGEIVQSDIKTVISDYNSTGSDFIRGEEEICNAELLGNNDYTITVSILNGVGTTGFGNNLYLD